MKTFIKYICVMGLVGSLALPVRGDITVTVTPGYQFSAGELPTTGTLNQLGMPTIGISGTLGGTNIAIAAGSITGTMLSGTVVDGVTVDFNGSNPRAIEVMAQGIHTNNLDTNDFQLPLTDTGGQFVKLLYDGSTIKTNGNGALYVPFTNFTTVLLTNIQGVINTLIGAGTNGVNTNLGLSGNFQITNGTLGFVRFISTNVTLPGQNSFFISLPHGLSNTPASVRWVLVNQSAELGYNPGDEVDVATTRDSNSAGPHFTQGGNATNVLLVAFSGNNIQVINTNNNNWAAITTANWKAKCYANP